MASKSDHASSLPAEDIEELLDGVDKALDRVKVLYEQYFLGIQKQAPAFIHNDVERKLRDLAQLQVRNTGLRYRLATLQQKFGAYNSYWRRTMRQIENGTYVRNLSKVGRKAVRSGEDIPDEILAAMPKRMREQVLRDREAAAAIAARRKTEEAAPEQATAEEVDDDVEAFVSEPSALRRGLRQDGAHVLDASDADLDFEAFFASVEQAPASAATALPAAPKPAAPKLAAPKPAAVPTIPKPSVVPPVAKPAAAVPRPITDSGDKTQPLPVVARPPATKPPMTIPKIPPLAPSQTTRPIPVMPGAAAAKGDTPVEQLKGPFPREAPKPAPAPKPASTPAPKPAATAPRPAPARPPRPEPAPKPPPPPGMTDADVNALYAKFVKAKEALGQAVGPGGYSTLLRTINQQAPKIMEQYKAKSVDFSVVVKDNQVVIRAKPKG